MDGNQVCEYEKSLLRRLLGLQFPESPYAITAQIAGDHEEVLYPLVMYFADYQCTSPMLEILARVVAQKHAREIFRKGTQNEQHDRIQTGLYALLCVTGCDGDWYIARAPVWVR